MATSTIKCQYKKVSKTDTTDASGFILLGETTQNCKGIFGATATSYFAFPLIGSGGKYCLSILNGNMQPMANTSVTFEYFVIL